MAATRARDPGNPPTIPCEILFTVTEQFLGAAQSRGQVRLPG